MISAIQYARTNGLMTDAAKVAPDEAVCAVCFGVGGFDSDEPWPTAPAWQTCTTCKGTGISPNHTFSPRAAE